MKSILWHFVLLVNVLKEAVPSSAPEGLPWNAIQLTTKDPFVPGPDSNTQTRKLLRVTPVVQTTAESWTLLEVLSSWPMDTNPRIFAELENTEGYCTVLQWSNPGDDMAMFTLPLWKRFCPTRNGNHAWRLKYKLLIIKTTLVFQRVRRRCLLRSPFPWNEPNYGSTLTFSDNGDFVYFVVFLYCSSRK